MKTVLIIGAGGALAQAQSLRPSHHKDHPPLDADFFPKAEALASRRPLVQAELTRFGQRLKDYVEFSDPFHPVPAPLEQFFADVYYEVASQRNRAAFDVFVSLIRLYGQVLAATTNWMAVRQNTGVHDKLLRQEIVNSAPDRPTVITFNQDLVLENAATRLKKRKDQWCLNSLYGEWSLSPLVATESTTPVFKHHDDSCPDNPPIDLLKLHGSLNWGLTSATEDPTIGTVFPRGTARKVHVMNRRQVRVAGMMRTGSARGRKRWHLWPLIVPPIYDKQRIIGMQILQSMWKRASDAITEADRLVLVGYSLPESDISARQMLRRSFSANSPLRSVVLVNPDPTMGAKLQRILGAKILHVYSDLGSYLDENVSH